MAHTIGWNTDISTQETKAAFNYIQTVITQARAHESTH